LYQWIASVKIGAVGTEHGHEGDMPLWYSFCAVRIVDACRCGLLVPQLESSRITHKADERTLLNLQ
jgi:hypothetical protein